MSNTVISTYSKLANKYDDSLNLTSCWGQAATDAVESISIERGYSLVVDVGCGTGHSLAVFADTSSELVRFVGVEPAAGMRARAVSLNSERENVSIVDGGFESLPLEDSSVDYLFSIFAFHWTTNLDASVSELSRVLKPDGAMDLFFIGRNNGREFIRATSPIFLRYLGPKGLLDAAALRQQLTLAQTEKLFAGMFDNLRLTVDEQYHTYYDSLDGHLGWWVRIEGQFVEMAPDRRDACDEEVRHALAKLQSDQGIPYTLHRLHVRLDSGTKG